jgi:signal transduction histidine kinase/CheY-like chemotaxis protein
MNFNIRAKIVLITVGILFFAIGTNTLINSYVFTREYSNALQSETFVIGQSLRYQLDKLLRLKIPIEELTGFEKQCQDVVNEYKDVSYAMVVDTNGKILFHNDPSQHGKILTDPAILKAVKREKPVGQVYSQQGEEYYDNTIPIWSIYDEHIAAVRVGFATKLITYKTGRLLMYSLGVAFVSLGLATTLLVFALSVWVTKPLMKLLTIIHEIRIKGAVDLARRVTIDSDDEIGQLSSAFNQMIADLEESQEKINRYTQELELANKQLQCDIVARHQAEEALQKAHDELENRVKERTAELANTNEHLRQEIAERQQTEEELHQAKEAADVANQAKSQFLAHMSHELRTPLNGILGYAQILRRDKRLAEKHREAIEIMEQSGKHLLRMINDILDLSRIEAGEMELTLTDFYLPELVKTVREITRVQAQQKGTSLDYNLAPELQVAVHGDKTRLRQILLNLLGNAITFTERGGIMLRVMKLGTGDSILDTGNPQSTSCIRFQIEDTGIGIPSEQLKKIFEPFRQVKDIRIQSKGIGLGLAISQRLLRMMDSELHVESSVGQGSTFWFDVELPEVEHVIASTAKPSQNIIGFKRPSTTSSTGSGQDSGHTAYKILIADDEAGNLRVLKDVLLPLGFEIVEAVHGRDALDKTAEFHPDMILMDLVMPVMDGLEATRQIRKLEIGYSIPDTSNQHPASSIQHPAIIAISANAFEQTRQESAEAGCDAFLVKPFDIDELLEQLRVHLHLEWLYEDESDGHYVEACPEPFIGVSNEQSRSTQDKLHRRGGAHPSEHIVPPPAEELAPLCELIRKGDIMGVYPYADRIEQIGRKYALFVMKVRQLAKAFRIDELEAFINHYMEDK